MTDLAPETSGHSRARSGAPGCALIARPLGFRRQWVIRVTLGEVIGCTAPAVVGSVLATTPTAVAVPALVAAGLVEGTLLGAAQASLLRWLVPDLRVGRFVLA